MRAPSGGLLFNDGWKCRQSRFNFHLLQVGIPFLPAQSLFSKTPGNGSYLLRCSIFPCLQKILNGSYISLAFFLCCCIKKILISFLFILLLHNCNLVEVDFGRGMEELLS